jgi:hypothetical protein
VSRGTQDPRPKSPGFFAYGAVTRYGRPFQTVRLKPGFVTLRSGLTRNRQGPMTPAMQRIRAITHRRFRLFPFRSPLLRESQLIYFPPGTEMFHFPGSASRSYGFRSGCSAFNGTGSPIRASPVHSLFAALRGLSQLTTPFLASSYQGIHRTPFVA